MGDALDLQALAPILKRELAKRSLIDFAHRIDPNFIAARHIEHIADHLERLDRGEIKRLLICMPPRHGKTALVSQKFTAYYLGRHPSHQIILASYGAELAEGNSRAVRTMVNDDAYPFDVKVREDSRASNRWETTAGGVIVATGTGGGLTGRGGHLIVCDDLVKDRTEAESDTIRASTAAWFSDVLRTRAMPDAKFLMVGTRWHEDDVLGRVLVEDGWTKIILPLIAEEDDAIGREPGEWLWDRFGPGDIPSAERGEISSRSFAALYQQRPSPAAGNVFKRDWFTNRYPGGAPVIKKLEPVGFLGSLASIDRPADLYCAIDCASKTGVNNDYSAIVTLAVDGRNIYVVDVVQERLEFPDLIRRVLEVHDRWRPRMTYIEEASSGFAVVQALKANTRLNVLGVKPQGSKESRADAVSPFFESGRVYLPERAGWIDKYIDEMCAFPAGRHDDMVDATTLGIAEVTQDHMRRQASGRLRQSLSSWMQR